MLEKIEQRIKDIEATLEQRKAEVTQLFGHLNEARHFLDMATKAAEVVAPESPVTDVLETVDKAVDAVEDAQA